MVNSSKGSKGRTSHLFSFQTPIIPMVLPTLRLGLRLAPLVEKGREVHIGASLEW